MADPEDPIDLEKLPEWPVIRSFIEELRKIPRWDGEARRRLADSFGAMHPELKERFELMAFPGEAASPETSGTLDKFDLSEDGGLRAAKNILDHLLRSAGRVMPERLGDYRILEEIGRGGMGVVYKAEQESLGRHVAVKVSHDQSERHRAQLNREARAAGRLHHSSIVPIFGVGRDLSSRLDYIVMQLIEGTCLAKMIEGLRERRGEPGQAAAGPSESTEGGLVLDGLRSPSTRPRTVAEIGIQVSNAIEYAHSNGIYHRDLKPSNLLIQGEKAWVADFGLARRLEVGTDPVNSHLDDSKGTLRFLPPEMLCPRSGVSIRGSIGAASSRSRDVYSLGVTLYEALTLTQAFDAPTRKKLVSKIRDQEPTKPRSLDRRIPADLQAIILKAMAKDPKNRYKTAGELGDDLRNFLGGYPVKARPVGLAGQLGKLYLRKPAAMVFATISTALVLLAVSLGWMYDRQRRDHDLRASIQAEEHAHSIERLIAETKPLLGRARRARPWESEPWRELHEAAERIKLLLMPHQDDRFLPSLDKLVEEARSGREVAGLLTKTAAAYQGAFTDPDGSATEERYGRAFREAGIDLDSNEANASKLTAFLRRSPSGSEEVAAVLDHWATLRRRGKFGSTGWRSLLELAGKIDPDPNRDQYRQATTEDDLSRAIERLKRALEDRPAGFPVVSVILLARTLSTTGDLEGAESLLRHARSRSPHDPWLNYYLGDCLRRRGGRERKREAIRYFSVARALRPETAFQLAQILEEIGQGDEAILILRELVQVPPGDGIILAELGKLLKRQGKPSEARTAFATAIDELRRVATVSGADHNAIGVALHETGDVGGAVVEYREAVRLSPKLVEAHHNLVVALCDLNRAGEAEKACRSAMSLMPGEGSFYNTLGIALLKQDLLDGAIEAYREAVLQQPDDGEAYCNLGIALHDKGQIPEAVKACSRATQLRPDLAETHFALGNAYKASGRPAEAIEEFREATRLRPDFAKAHSMLGITLGAQGWAAGDKALLGRAMDECKTAKDLAPTDARIVSNLGHAYLYSNKIDDAIAEFKRAIELDDGIAAIHYNLGLVLRKRRDFERARDAFKEAVRLEPDLAPAICYLGIVMQDLGAYREGLAELKRGHLKGIKDPNWSHPSARWVQAAEVLADLEARIPALKDGRDQPRDAGERLAFALVCYTKKLYTTSTRLYAELIREQPEKADDPATGLRYDAACSAALAGCGRGDEEATPPGEAGRIEFRNRAFGWLDADLSAWSARLGADREQTRQLIDATLSHWRVDPDLAGIRDKDGLMRLPEEERSKWLNLWSRVGHILDMARSGNSEPHR